MCTAVIAMHIFLFQNHFIMKHILTIILCLLELINAKAGCDIYVAVNFQDCVNCNAMLYSLTQKTAPKPISLVFKKDLQEDSILVVEKFDLYNDKKYKLIFSDSFFNEITIKTASTIAVYDSGILRYKHVLKTANINLLDSILYNLRSFKKIGGVKYGQVYYDDGAVLNIKRNFDLFKYIDSGRTITFKADSNDLEKAYKMNYKSSYKPYLEEIKKTIKIMPVIKGRYCNLIKKNDATLSIFEIEPFLKYEFVTKSSKIDTIGHINFISYINEYSFRGDSITTYKIEENKTAKNNKYVSNTCFHYRNGYYYFLSALENDLTTDTKFLARYKENRDEKKINFVAFANVNVPSNYIKYHFKDTFQQLLFNRNLVAYSVGNIIYDIDADKVYNIPLPDEEFASVEGVMARMMNGEKPIYYRLLSITDKGKNIEIIYANKSDELVFMKFDKTDPTINEKSIITKNYRESKIGFITFYRDHIIYSKFNDEMVHDIVL